jgi:hypothetical protein
MFVDGARSQQESVISWLPAALQICDAGGELIGDAQLIQVEEFLSRGEGSLWKRGLTGGARPVLNNSGPRRRNAGERGVGAGRKSGVLLPVPSPSQPAIYSCEAGGGELREGSQQRGPRLPGHAIYSLRGEGVEGGGVVWRAGRVDHPVQSA